MNTGRVVLAMLFISISHIAVAETADETKVDYSVIFDGLPWEFRHTSTPLKEEQAETSTRYDFVSIKPLKKTARGAIYLKADLTVIAYRSSETATEALRNIQGKAHPDMGLSYAWDYLLLQDKRLYHLHSGCVMSEENFDIMVKNLRKGISREGDIQQAALRCRCGGGCRLQQDSSSSTEQGIEE
ncbi:MAG TPA: hypothetical protein DDW45_09635 [Gammaproteobacteria bacterium]|nr:hypothetical protein [Gammaproteobacteria bacterium]